MSGLAPRSLDFLPGYRRPSTGDELPSTSTARMLMRVKHCKSEPAVGSKRYVLLGICAMEKKAKSKYMHEILSRLQEFECIKLIIFDQATVFNEKVEKWPIVDALIAFYSKGFPLEKAVKYAKLRNPYLINDIEAQYDLLDRRKVYAKLKRVGIPHPRYAVLDRDDPAQLAQFVENDDNIEFNGHIFYKPFVEKPVSAEDHNIYIYYPPSAGGGSQRLFRKIGCRSSVYSRESNVRNRSSYIYEEFLATDGTDVKVYTVGPEYAHAEARKSPALDGIVERDSHGKEVRYPVILSNQEKLIARKVVLAFRQIVCGFDLLRTNGTSYVCDVNGFSFVKNSMIYYDDCSKILANQIMSYLSPLLHIPWNPPFTLDEQPLANTTSGKLMELRAVIGVIRHSDRTPKQKMKMEVYHPKFYDIYRQNGGTPTVNEPRDVKLKTPKQLQLVLDAVRSILDGNSADDAFEMSDKNRRAKLEQLRSVLEMYGYFSGINRKIQLRYQPRRAEKKGGSSGTDEEPMVGGSAAVTGNAPATNNSKPNNNDVVQASGSNNSLRTSRNSTGSGAETSSSLLLIAKWGGELTPLGRYQAESLGKVFRCMYPGGPSYKKRRGLGFLRLHSTFRNDLKIYASDEGRVQTTAAAFSKGLLALEGELTPIMVQMVKTENSLLDNDVDARGCQMAVKCRIHEILHQNREFNADDHKALNPLNLASVRTAMSAVRNPLQACQRLHEYIQRLCLVMRRSADEISEFSSSFYSSGESRDLLMRRWSKLEKDFKHKDGTFDISKIPDIYDCIKFDSLHRALKVPFAQDFFLVAKGLADIVIPLEYGITRDEKTTIAQGICSPLLRKIRADIYRVINSDTSDDLVHRLNPRFSKNVSSPKRLVRTRLYFTSESHLHSLVNILRFGGLFDELVDEQWRRSLEYLGAVSELNFLTQIVFMLYEDPTYSIDSEQRFLMEIHFSPGMMPMYEIEEPEGPGFRTIYREGSPSDEAVVTQLQQQGQQPNAAKQPAEAPPSEVQRTTADLSTLTSTASAADRRHSAAVDGSDSSGGSGTPSTPVAPVGNSSKTSPRNAGDSVSSARASEAVRSAPSPLAAQTDAALPANANTNIDITYQQHYISPDEPIISVSRFKVRRLGRPPPPPSSESSNGSTKSPGSPGSSSETADVLAAAIAAAAAGSTSAAVAETLKRLNGKTGGGIRQQSDPVAVPGSPSGAGANTTKTTTDDDMNNNSAASMATINVPSSRFDRFAQKKRIGSIALRIVPTAAQPAASRKVDMSALFSTSVIRGGGAAGGTRATSIQQLARGGSVNTMMVNGSGGAGMASSTFRDADSDPSGLAGAGLIVRTSSGGSTGTGSIGSGSGVTVPNIYGLETLHNGLSLKRFEAFLSRVTIGYLSSRSLSPSSTPMYKHVTQSDILKMLQSSNNKLAMQSQQQQQPLVPGATTSPDDPAALLAAAKRANAIALAVSDMLLTPDNNTNNTNNTQGIKPSGSSMFAVASMGHIVGGVGIPPSKIQRQYSQSNASRINDINVVNPHIHQMAVAAAAAAASQLLGAGGSTDNDDAASEELSRLSSSSAGGEDELSAKSKHKRGGSKKVRIKDVVDGAVNTNNNAGETEIVRTPTETSTNAMAIVDLPAAAPMVTEKSGSGTTTTTTAKPSGSIGVMRRFNGNPPCAVDNFRSLLHMPSSSAQCRSTDALSSALPLTPLPSNSQQQQQQRSLPNMRKPSRENSVAAVNTTAGADESQQRRPSGGTLNEEEIDRATIKSDDEQENINNVNTTGTTLVIEPSASIPGTERRGSFQRRQCVDNDEKDHEERDRRLLDTLSEEERHAVLYMRTTTVDESHYT